MKDNTVIMLAAVLSLAVGGVVSLIMGQDAFAGVCWGALAGLVGGHLNGTAVATPTPGGPQG